jgi:tRNA pseudouridine38-40 synthase
VNLAAVPGTKPRTRPPKGGRRYRMTIAYDGTDFFGWQAQPDTATVQGTLEAALLRLTGETVRVHSCGRTDTGVHARAQVAHFDLHRPWEASKLQKGLNAILPETVRVPELRRARPDFHARYDAQGKEYRFFIWNAPVSSPLHRRQAVHVRQPLDLAAMRQAASLLEGTHDFAAFSANPHREIGGTVRTLWRLSVRKQGSRVVLAAVGDGFLYKMVRSLAGHLLRVGLGKVPASETPVLLSSKLRTARVETAPAHGLCLWKIHYGAIPGLPKPAPV